VPVHNEINMDRTKELPHHRAQEKGRGEKVKPQRKTRSHKKKSIMHTHTYPHPHTLLRTVSPSSMILCNGHHVDRIPTTTTCQASCVRQPALDHSHVVFVFYTTLFLFCFLTYFLFLGVVCCVFCVVGKQASCG
jgi:hypothetical protein